jgi:hypothetical protein
MILKFAILLDCDCVFVGNTSSYSFEKYQHDNFPAVRLYIISFRYLKYVPEIFYAKLKN